jgi:glycerol-3-phosphate dehydrogenase (NAD(P)+)
MADNLSVGVIGGGAWGTALSILANRAGSKVTLGTRNANVIKAIQENRCNDIYLPSVFVDPAITVTDKFDAVCKSDVVIFATPSHVLRMVSIIFSDMLETKIPIIVASKGVERGSLMLMSEVVQSVLPYNPIGVISGPNFADEAAKGLPTATTIASADRELLDKLAYAVGGRMFRPYLSDDIIGAQIGGAVKNVIAIACGIAVGRGMGENARAALVTRGFTEMARLTLAKGGKYETLMGLSGLGDLLLTCGSPKSRNMSLGLAIGQGKPVEDVISSRGRSATEGYVAAESLIKLARKLGVSMPICEAIYYILYEKTPIDQAISQLLERPITDEQL